MPKQIKPCWSGDPVEPKMMIAYIQACLSKVNSGTLHYALEYPNYQRTAETLFFLRIVCFDQIDGTQTIQAAFDGVLQKRDVRNGDFLIGGYNSNNIVINPTEKRYGGLSVIFHPHFIRIYYGVCDHGLLSPQFYYHLRRKNGPLFSMFQSMGEILKETECERDLRCRPLLTAIFHQLIVDLRRCQDQQEQMYDRTALRLRGFMEQNFHQLINCTTVCEALHINRTYAAALFKKNFHISMNDYLLHLRIDTAKYLLSTSSSLNVADIARLCAFTTSGYFTQVFRKSTGLSPAKYRQQMR